MDAAFKMKTEQQQSKSGKPTVTRPRAQGASREAGRRASYVASKSKTDLGMLHQSQALKATAADKARDRSETGGGGGASRKLTGNMVEVSAAAQAAAVTPVQQDREMGRKAQTSRVFVVGKNHAPLMPCHPARARALLKAGRAVVHRHCRLVQRADGYAYFMLNNPQPAALPPTPSRPAAVALVSAPSLR